MCRIGWQVIFIFIAHVTCDSLFVYLALLAVSAFCQNYFRHVFEQFLVVTAWQQRNSKPGSDSYNSIAA
jgi:hypothetical protein